MKKAGAFVAVPVMGPAALGEALKRVTPSSSGKTSSLGVDASGRFLVQGDGTPFLIHGDTPWSIAVQLTTSQIDSYLDDRAGRGFNTIMFNLIEHYFSGQNPAWKNATGDPPFGSMNSAGSRVDWLDPVEAYWSHVDYIVAEAGKHGILCIVQPAYLGFGGGSGTADDQGWDSAIDRARAADLEGYGEWLANRYPHEAIVWCMGGDYVPSNVSTQWRIATGIRNVDARAIITAHGSRESGEAYPDWKGEVGFNLNSIYSHGVEYDLAATAYARSAPTPFFLIEGYYDGEKASGADCRRQAYTAILGGGCGHLFGNNPIWGFGEPHANGGKGAAAALKDGLGTSATQQMTHVKALFDAYAWWKLEPAAGSSLVTTDLGSGTSRVVPAVASDGSFAMIWRSDRGSVTVDMTALDPSSKRARFYDTTGGTFAPVSGSPGQKRGTESFDWPGERILVLDAE